MKSIPKLIRRFVGILLLSSILILIMNFAVLAIITAKQSPNGRPWVTAEEAANALHKTTNGYVLTEDMSEELASCNAWAMFIDNDTHSVVWQTDDLPDTVPKSYTISDIANLTRGYINDYPTFTGESDTGLMVLGYPKDSYWKSMWPSWDYHLIANFPRIVLVVLAVNFALIFLIYMIANTKLLKSIKPIADGIQDLPTEKPVHIKEKGLLSELAAHINQASEVLQSQKYQLRKKETARANWITGVSHDIRTPLSMVMGYASQLLDATHLTEEEHKKTSVILKQSERIRNLINDLNLASKLEYNMQPTKLMSVNAVSVVRQVIVDFINNDIDDKYPIEWQTEESLEDCFINADRDLLKRAISNLMQNCINHNANGCIIYVTVQAKHGKCIIHVEDNGVGATDEQIQKLNNTPHYMVCDDNTVKQRHGLGLLIVKQIVANHHGDIYISQSSYGGFSVQLIFPLHEGLYKS